MESDPPTAEEARPAAGYVIALALGVLALYVAAPVNGLPGLPKVAAGHVALTAAPLAAALLAGRAARRGPAAVRLPWGLLAAAASLVVVGQLLWAVHDLTSPKPLGFPSLSFACFVAFHLLLAAAALAALQPGRAPGFHLEIALDAGLILFADALVVMRLVLEPLIRNAQWITGREFAGILAGQLASVGSLFLVGILLVSRRTPLPGTAVARITAAAAVFAVGNALVVAGLDPDPAHPGDPFDLVWLAGWGLLASAPVAPARTTRLAAIDAQRLRRAIVPGAALFLGAAALHAAFGPPVSVAAGVTLAALAVVLSVRIATAVRAAERRAEERQRLAHTQALVELSRALAEETELDRVLDLVSAWTCRLLDAGAAGIELLAEDGRSLELRATAGAPDHYQGMRFPVEQSFTGWVVRHGRPRATDDAARDPLLHPQSVEFLGHSPLAAVPLRVRGRTLGALSACIRERPFDGRDLEVLEALADQAALAIEDARLFAEVRALSFTDPLTGVANRRALERDLNREFAAARRGRRLVAVLFDLDGFKDYNDRYGHIAGDEALCVFGRILAAETRAANISARYGGDEFILLLTDCDLTGAEVVARRIQERFPPEVARLGRGPLTVSAGMATHSPEMQGPEDLIAAADTALYRAKPPSGPRRS